MKEAPLYAFKTLADLTATSVKDQCRTGTCWSFSTTSFLESEAARISGEGVGTLIFSRKNPYRVCGPVWDVRNSLQLSLQLRNSL